MSSYGWTYLSRDALRRAENQLSGAGDGVRDEIGFLIVHQRYADHFFPGTSVLHTRMRYALFVPWIYQTLYEEGSSGRAQDIVEKAEIRLAGRLKHLRGAIGGSNYPRPTSQPASLSYWAALGAWGILRETDGRLPSRAQIHALLQSKHRKARDVGVNIALPIEDNLDSALGVRGHSVCDARCEYFAVRSQLAAENRVLWNESRA